MKIKIRFVFYWFLIKLQNAIIYIVEFTSKSARGRLISGRGGGAFFLLDVLFIAVRWTMGITAGDSAYKNRRLTVLAIEDS